MDGQDPQPGSQPPEANPTPAFARLGLRTPPGWTPLPADQPLPTPVVPDYTLIRRVGGGAYGEVWLARNFTGSFFAIKVVHRCLFDHERPYERELAGIRRFEPISRSHPSQVAIHHVGQNTADGYFYCVMDLADDAAEEGGRQKCRRSEVRSPKFEVRSPRSRPRPPGSGIWSLPAGIRHPTSDIRSPRPCLIRPQDPEAPAPHARAAPAGRVPRNRVGPGYRARAPPRPRPGAS